MYRWISSETLITKRIYLKNLSVYLSKSIGLLFSVCAEGCSLVSQPIFNVIFRTELSFIRALL